jgi:hypothetical protein
LIVQNVIMTANPHRKINIIAIWREFPTSTPYILVEYLKMRFVHSKLICRWCRFQFIYITSVFCFPFNNESTVLYYRNYIFNKTTERKAAIWLVKLYLWVCWLEFAKILIFIAVNIFKHTAKKIRKLNEQIKFYLKWVAPETLCVHYVRYLVL